MVPRPVRNRNRTGLWQLEATAALALAANLEGRCRTTAALWRARTGLSRHGFLIGGKTDGDVAVQHELVTGAPVIAQMSSPTIPTVTFGHCQPDGLRAADALGRTQLTERSRCARTKLLGRGLLQRARCCASARRMRYGHRTDGKRHPRYA